MRLISRWFFEPTIFLMMKLIMREPAPRRGGKIIRPNPTGKGNWFGELAAAHDLPYLKAMKLRLSALLVCALAAVAHAQSPAPAPPPPAPQPGSAPGTFSVGGNSAGLPIPKDGQQAMAAATELLKNFLGTNSSPLAALGGKQPADIRELKALLPTDIAGLRRTAARGEKSGAFGATVAQARGEYGEKTGPHLEIKLTDLAAMGPFGVLAGMGWTAGEVDSEGDDGYERTTKFNGHKALEKYSSATKSGSATVIVSDRFLVEITGRDIAPDTLKSAAAALDFNALEALGKRP